jgi:hypothetical protein
VARTDSSHTSLRRTQRPGPGIIPCGLPPFAFHENQNAIAVNVATVAKINASQIQCERQLTGT